jgi:hypothetical protein
MSNTLIYVGIAIGVAAIAGVVVYGTNNQQNYISENAVLAPAAEEGTLSSPSGTVTLNKEKWHEDPFGDLAQKIREQNGR